MFKNYFKTAYRSLVKNKAFSLLNIFGLAIGMAACFFIFQYVHFETSYDRFHKNAKNLYRVPISYSGSFSGKTATNHPATGPALKAEFPEVVAYYDRVLREKGFARPQKDEPPGVLTGSYRRGHYEIAVQKIYSEPGHFDLVFMWNPQ